MRVFLLDLWLDLREKRLTPVAILLLAGIVAVPIVLAKGREAAPAAAPTTTTATTASAAPVIQSAPEAGPVSSKLQTFSARDPFEPTGGGGSSTGGTDTSGATGTTGTGTTGTGTTTTGGTGTTGGGTTGTQPGTGTTTTPSTGNTTGETKTTLFTYTVDLRFGEAGDMQAYKAVNRLELIPDDKNPKVVFLGVTSTAKTAVFLIDNNIGVDTGEGACRPSADNCTFLYLRPDTKHDEAVLTDADGTVYHIRLLALNRVSVSSSNGTTKNGSSTGNSNSNSNSNRSPAFTGNAKSSDETVPGETPPGEPDTRSSFQQFFADSSGDSTSTDSTDSGK
jgi:hypothetical protein